MAFPRRERALFRRAHRSAQDGIHEFHNAGMSVFLGQLHRLIAGGRWRYFIHIEELIEPQAQDIPDHRRNLADGTVDIMADHPVQRSARLDGAVRKFREEPAVDFREFRFLQVSCQRDIGVGSLFIDFTQDSYG